MENNGQGWVIAFFLGALVWALFFHKDTYEGQTAEEWFNEYDYQVDYSERLKDALENANNNIEEANDEIESAKWYAWESYEDMGDALDGLDTVDTVLEP